MLSLAAISVILAAACGLGSGQPLARSRASLPGASVVRHALAVGTGSLLTAPRPMFTSANVTLLIRRARASNISLRNGRLVALSSQNQAATPPPGRRTVTTRRALPVTRPWLVMVTT